MPSVSFFPPKTSIMMAKTKAELEQALVIVEQQLQEARTRIRLLEQHFESCRTPSVITPPPDHYHNETSVRSTVEELPANGQGSTNTTASTQERVLVHTDIAIEQAPTSTEVSSSPKGHGASNSTTSGGQVARIQKRKWEIDVSKFERKIKKPRYKLQNPKADLDYDVIIAMIVCGTSGDAQVLPMDSTMDAIAAAKRYAYISGASQARAQLFSCIASFQNLIFHSICAVLEYCGYPATDIDKVMRIRSSASGPKNLKRLRAGAVWGNEVISTVTHGEWTEESDHITRIYFHCNITMSAYGCLADSKTATTPLIIKALRGFQSEDMPQSWCIPAFVRLGLPASKISLEDICSALKYKPTSVLKIMNIVSKYEGILQLQRHPLSRSIGGSEKELESEKLLESPTEDFSPPGSSNRFPLTGNGQTASAELAAAASGSSSERSNWVNVDEYWDGPPVFLGGPEDNQEILTRVVPQTKTNVDHLWEDNYQTEQLFEGMITV